MFRKRSIWLLIAAAIVGLGGLTSAQVFVPAQPRSPAQPASVPAPPTERQIPVGTSLISGTVTADDGTPVGTARVQISGQVAMSGAAPGNAGMWLSRTVMTDDNGGFAFQRMPAGAFSITVSSLDNQFLPVNYGQRRPLGAGQQIRLADGQKVAVKIPLARGSVITGMALGPNGEPQRNAQVRAIRFETSSGFRRLQSTGYAQTDDRGVYRIFNLQPGEYYISVTPNPSRLQNGTPMGSDADLVERAIMSDAIKPPTAAGMPATVSVPIQMTTARTSDVVMYAAAYLPTYAPNSMTLSGATAVTVGPGQEQAGINVQVQLIQASTIQGVVSASLDDGVAVQLTLQSDDPLADLSQGAYARTDSTGSFLFRAVPPGSYTVLAQTVVGPRIAQVVNGQSPGMPQPPPGLTDAQKLWGRARVVVSGETKVPINISLQPGRSISGVVLFDMKQRPDLTHAQVRVSSAPSLQQAYSDNGQLQAPIGPDGRFTITGVPPGRYILRTDYSMRSAIASGQDTLDFPLEFNGDRDVTDAVLTVTDQLSQLNGTLTDSTGKPANDYMIVVASTDSRYWVPGSRRVRTLRPNADGNFSIQGLPCGAYQISVLTDLEPGAQHDPEFLRAIGRTSIPVMIPESGKVTQNLRVK